MQKLLFIVDLFNVFLGNLATKIFAFLFEITNKNTGPWFRLRRMVVMKSRWEEIRKTFWNNWCWTAMMAANRTQRISGASATRQTSSQSLSFGIHRILNEHQSCVTPQTQPQQPILLPRCLQQLPASAPNLLAPPFPWRPYFGVVTMATNSVTSTWLASHPCDLALSLATTGACVNDDV